jgi:hypothetical protein
VMSAMLAAVPITECTSPDSASTPMWAFMPHVALVHMWRPTSPPSGDWAMSAT